MSGPLTGSPWAGPPMSGLLHWVKTPFGAILSGPYTGRIAIFRDFCPDSEMGYIGIFRGPT
ncbi:hypothetical protein BV22DRAFT_1037647, partial [Leucogyrophana mollusca]